MTHRQISLASLCSPPFQFIVANRPSERLFICLDNRRSHDSTYGLGQNAVTNLRFQGIMHYEIDTDPKQIAQMVAQFHDLRQARRFSKRENYAVRCPADSRSALAIQKR